MGKKNTGATFSSSRFGVPVSVVPNIFTIYPQHFLKPEISETLLGSFTKFFGTVKQTFFDGILWYHLLGINIFDIPIFLKHWSDAHEIFQHCETEKVRRKNVIHLFSSTQLSETRIFSKTVGVPYEVFRHCETKIFHQKIVTPSCIKYENQWWNWCL